MRFEIARFRLILEARETLRLPGYKGSTLRGAFGHAFKKVVCIRRDGKCPDCLIRQNCVYEYVFETPPPPGSEMMRKYPYAPHPFVIEPDLEGRREYHPGESLSFGLVLIGKAIDYLPYFIYTFDELGSGGLGRGRGRFTLKGVEGIGSDGRAEPIYDGSEKRLTADYPKMVWDGTVETQAGAERLKLSFLTPTRIRYEGGLILELEFHILIRGLLRRLSTLAYFHCGGRLELDYRGLIAEAQKVRMADRALRWYDWERYSSRQETRMSLGGFVGDVVFEGKLGMFMSFLRLGEQVHVGKGTSFGLGKYEIQDVTGQEAT